MTKEKNRRELSLGEEIMNGITHGIGAAISIAALVLLVVFGAIKGTAWHVVGYSIFGACLIILYLSSTFYHSFTNPKLKDLFARFDHVSIFLLIAGTYTPFLLTIRGAVCWTLFGAIWGLALIGAIVRSIYVTEFRRLMVVVYLLMGWSFVFAYNSFMDNLSSLSLTFLFIGGLSYSIGVIFYAWRNLPYGHGIWHLFVLGGSIMHFFAALFLLEF